MNNNSAIQLIIAIGSFVTAIVGFVFGYLVTVNSDAGAVSLTLGRSDNPIQAALELPSMAAGICFAAFGMAVAIVAISKLLKQ
jgi:hypothetical protein